MKLIFKNFLILFCVFSLGMFIGEWLLDYVLSSARESIRKEIVDAIIIGGFVSVFLIFTNKSLREGKK